MRAREFTAAISEGGDAGAKRYNSEVAVICAITDSSIDDFDARAPADNIPAKYLQNPREVYRDIENLLAPNFDADMFAKWYSLALKFRPLIIDKMRKNQWGLTGLTWAGGKNQADNAADVGFANSAVAGISVKAEGGITLANLTPASLGLTPDRGNDIFYHYAQSEFIDMKRNIFTDVMAEARNFAGRSISFDRGSKYSIVYDKNTKQFECIGKNKFVGTEAEILAKVAKNAPWQRVFGDWFQANWQTKKQYARPLFTKIAVAFEKTIEQHLATSDRLANLLRFASQPYFYMTSNSLYFVPTADTAADLKLHGLRYAEPDGTGQLFAARIGRPDSQEAAEIAIYIRYANGLFESNPTVRIQNLKDPQFIGWEKLN